MSQELGKRNLRELTSKQIKELNSTLLFPNLDKDSELIKLFNHIIGFHSKATLSTEQNEERKLPTKNPINFIDYYCKNESIDCTPTKFRTNLLNNLRVKKKRLNDDLKKYNYEIDRNYYIFQVKEITLENMIVGASNLLYGKLITEVKIFDTYTRTNKNKIFTPEVFRLLKRVLSFGGKIEIISVFDTEETKDFYKGLLSFNKKGSLDLQIKYIRQPLHQSSSLLYILLTDDRNNNYILYFEETTRWSVTELVTKKTSFTSDFYGLLDTRFVHFFTDKILKKNNEILDVDLSFFTKDVQFYDNSKVFQLIKNMKDTLQLKRDEIDSVKEKTNSSILLLKELGISYPQMNFANKVLYYYIKLIEITFLSQIERKDKTTFIFKQLVSSGIVKVLNKKVRNIFITRDEFLLDINILPVNVSSLKILIQTFHIVNKSSLAEIFSELKWNNREQIVDSINDIILDKNMSLKLINYYLEKRSKELEKNTILIKYFVRQIFTLLKIKFSYNLENKDKDILHKLSFLDDDFAHKFPSLLDD